MDNQPFNQWNQTLDRNQVLSILIDLQNEGHSVVYKKPPAIDGWTILGPSPLQWVCVRPYNGETSWSVGVGNLGRSIGSSITTAHELIGYLNVAMKQQGISTDDVPRQVSLEGHKPVSNSAKLVAIIGTSSVDALWDGYLTNKSFVTLTNIASLGVELNSSLRIMAGDHETSRMLTQNKLTANFFEQFKNESALSAEVRLCTKGRSHDRFILLSDGRCLSPDFSINQMGNRGTVSELDAAAAQARKQWFDTEWSTGTIWT